MGLIRLMLAIAVLLSHVDLRIGGLNPGVMAVIGFYMISGYVMTGVVLRYYADIRKAFGFYCDRALRLYPHYLVIVFCAATWQQFTGSTNLFLTRDVTAIDLLNNLLIFPMTFFMWNAADQFALVPPSWSLGAELQFYLLAPLVILIPIALWIFTIASIAVQVCAWLGILHPEWFGYRLAPGVFCFFIYGVLLYRVTHPTIGKSYQWASATMTVGAVAIAVASLVWLRSQGLHAVPYHQEVLLGFAVGSGLLFLGSKLPRGRWDDRLGDLAYGVFLNHFLLIWVFWGSATLSPAEISVLIALSLLAAMLLHRLIEQPMLRFRHRLRQKGSNG